MEDDELNIEVLEFSLNDNEIDDLIESLKRLKQTQTNFSFEIDEEHELLIHHEEDLDDGDESDAEDEDE
jgi:hypothetical protein